jgi:hypothetical protein
VDVSSLASAKQNLVQVCERLKNENGVFIIDKDDRDQLSRAVEELEAVSEPPRVLDQDFERAFVGNWTLVCTSSTNTPTVVDRSRLPSFLSGPLDTVRSRISQLANKSIKVQQRIRTDAMTGQITRVDHVIEYSPLRSLRDVLSTSGDDTSNIPDVLSHLNLNPLDVSKSEVILVHKAAVSSTSGSITTTLTLQSIVLNVAGTSTLLDPDGKDVASLNLPQIPFLNDFIASNGATATANSFATTYMDDNLRVSRGKQGLFDQLRVFVKQRLRVEANVRVDVDEMQDPEFIYEDEDDGEVAAGRIEDHEGQDDVSPSDY